MGRTFIIAEISANHNQDFKRAIELIKAAHECGADAVKFQTYSPDTHTLDVDSDVFRIVHPEWGGQTLYELYNKTYTPWEWFPELKKVADDIGILFFSAASNYESVDLLENIAVPMHKVTSFELVDIDLIAYMAKTKKPIILSTGMASVAEINDAVSTVRENGGGNITLLKCVSAYPADPNEFNLKTIPDMKELFDCQVGLSDHSVGMGAAIAAVALGASVIEKHFTLSRSITTPDSFFSMEPHEFREMVINVRVAEQAIGNVHYGVLPGEETSRIFRRSLFVCRDIHQGDVLTRENIRAVRPGIGLPPKELNAVLGRVARYDLKKGTPLNWDIIG